MRRSDRRLQILSGLAVTGGASSWSTKRSWPDLVEHMRYNFVGPSVVSHKRCPTCGSGFIANPHFFRLEPMTYSGKEKALRRMISDGQLVLVKQSLGWQIRDTGIGRTYLRQHLGAISPRGL